MASTDDDDWTQGWSWDLPAKPLADQLGPHRGRDRGDGAAHRRRAPFWRRRRRRTDLAVVQSDTAHLVG